MKLPNLRAAALILTSVFLIECSAIADDWPCFRGPNRNGVISGQNFTLNEEPERIWKTNVGKGNGGSAIVGDKLYVLGRNGDRQLHCLNAQTGEKIWVTSFEGWSTDSTPAVADGKVYVLASTNDPNAICFDAETGDELWKTPLPKNTGQRHYNHAGSPLIADDLVVFNAGTGAAVNRKTGELIWEADGLPGLATPVLFQHQRKPAVAIFCGDKLVGRDLETGDEIWTIPWKTNLAVNACDPIFFDNDAKVFVCSDYGLGRALYDLSGSSPTELWNHPKQGSGHAFSSGFYLNGKVHAFVRDLHQISEADGERGLKAGGSGSALVVDDTLIFVSEGGEMVAGKLKADSFEEEARTQLLGGHSKNAPSFANGNLFVRNEDGDVACFRIGS